MKNLETKIDTGSIMEGVKNGNWNKEMFPTDMKCGCGRDVVFMIRGVLVAQCGKCLSEQAEVRYQEILSRSNDDYLERARAKQAAIDATKPRDGAGWYADGKSKAAGY